MNTTRLHSHARLSSPRISRHRDALEGAAWQVGLALLLGIAAHYGSSLLFDALWVAR